MACLVLGFLSAPAMQGADTLEELETLTAPLLGTAPAQWRVIWTTAPESQATVSWTTAQPGTGHTVHWDTESHADNPDAYAHRVNCHRNGEYTRGEPDLKDPKKPVKRAWYHHARLPDLPSDRIVYFRMVSGGKSSKELHFRTAPPAGKPFSILSGGDSRSGHLERVRMNLMMARLAETQPGLIAFAHGGDYIAKGISWQQWSQWLSHHELATARDGRVLPVIPTRGNHDVGPLYNEIFDFPPSDPNFFATEINADLALITLNSNIPATGDQQDFLKAMLQTYRPKVRWLLTQYHRPAFPAVKTPGEAREAWVPLFEAHNVDLVLESDGHAIKRTVAIRNEKPDPTGVVYVGEGGLGVRQRTPKTDHWYLQPPGMAGAGHHVFLLDISPEQLRCRALLLKGGVADEVILQPRVPAKK